MSDNVPFASSAASASSDFDSSAPEYVSSSVAAPFVEPIAEIISIGDEIMTGAILDSNFQYLSRSLSEIGVKTVYHSSIADDGPAMIAAFGIAFRRADVVVVTGGLGPTQDDLTRQTVADALGVGLTFDPDSFERIKENFAARGRVMPETNKIQAYFPTGSQIIFNPTGTAPGFLFEGSRERFGNGANEIAVDGAIRGRTDGDFIVLTFPGVPAEMKRMWVGPDGRAAVERFAERITDGKRPIYRVKKIGTFGAGESALEARLPNLIARDRKPTVGITATDSIISLRIFAEGPTEAECERQIDETARLIYRDAGEFVFGEDDETLPSAVCRKVRAQCHRVAAFEWGTRGLLTAKIEQDVLGFSRIFGDDDRDAFERLLGVPTSGDDGSGDAQTSVKADNTSDFAARTLETAESVSAELRSSLNGEKKIEYLLAVGPFPNETNAESNAAGRVVVAFVDLRDPNKPILRRETYSFGFRNAVTETLYCNRAIDMLRRYL